METVQDDRRIEAFHAGRRAAFGVAAIATGCVAFLNLLGAEKAILAIVLGAIALRGAPPGAAGRRFGIAAIVLGAVFLVSEAVLLIVFREQFVELLRILENLG